MDHRVIVPGREGAGRAGRAPGPDLDLLAPLDRPVHARDGVPGRGHRRRERPRTNLVRPHPVHPQRDPPPVRRPDRRPESQNPRPDPPLVKVAPTPPGNRPRMSLSTQVTAPLNPIYLCRTSRPSAAKRSAKDTSSPATIRRTWTATSVGLSTDGSAMAILLTIGTMTPNDT